MRYAFRFRAYWFVLAQTEGEETSVEPIPGFDLDTALANLQIQRTAFDQLSGNVQGFARHRQIAVNPLAALPHKTIFHEIAHVVLGHTTSETLVDSESTPHHLCEVEAESVALICCETLGLDGAGFCRGYIQHWLNSKSEIPNKSAARIFAGATSILKAGISMAGSQQLSPLHVNSEKCEAIAYLSIRGVILLEWPSSMRLLGPELSAIRMATWVTRPMISASRGCSNRRISREDSGCGITVSILRFSSHHPNA